MKEKLSEIKGALLTGVSYMLPFVIAGGILIALGFAIGGYDIPNSVEEYGNFASTIFWLGKKAFALMVPVLGAYVAYSIADKPGIAVGMVGGALADMQGSGFLGALIAGIIAGYLVNLLKKINLPMALKSLLPTLIIPIIGVGAIGLIMVYVIGTPLSALTTALTDMLNSLGTGNLVLLGIIQGCMLAFDMGGPCNKVAYAFALAAMDAGNYMPMAANFIGSMAPPLAILMAGSAVGCALSYVFGLTMRAPHGGLFVLFALNNALLFIVALLIAGAVSAALLILLRKPAVEAEE